jgi:hypothetical protein
MSVTLTILSAAVVSITRAGPAGSCKLREVAIVPGDLPDVSNVSAGMTYRSSGYFAWGCFRYFLGGVLPGRTSAGMSWPLFISPLSSHIGLSEFGR